MRKVNIKINNNNIEWENKWMRKIGCMPNKIVCSMGLQTALAMCYCVVWCGAVRCGVFACFMAHVLWRAVSKCKRFVMKCFRTSATLSIERENKTQIAFQSFSGSGWKNGIACNDINWFWIRSYWTIQLVTNFSWVFVINLKLCWLFDGE